MTDFCGVLSLTQLPQPGELVAAMSAFWATRRYDRTATHQSTGLALFHGARWTTPEACHEHQPLIDQHSGRVYFGDIRIDNRKELSSELRLPMQSAVPITDIELLRSAFIAWGEACFNRVEGDYCLAIYDPKSRELLLARDHVGFKPLFYVQTGDYLAFASEATALLELPGINGAVDSDSLHASLLNDAIPANRTYFRDVSRLPAASVLRCRDGRQRVRRYWSFSDIEPDVSIGEQEASAELRRLLSEAVSVRSRSYGGLASELSGGLDSSTITSLLALQGHTHPTRCYSLRSASADWDEGTYIEALAEKYPLQLTSIWADQLDYRQQFSLESVYSQGGDWPLDLMFAPHLALADQAQEDGVRVILTGQGGDEVTQGSPRVVYDYWRSRQWRKLAREVAGCEHKWWLLRYHLLSPLLPERLRRGLRTAIQRSTGRHLPPHTTPPATSSDAAGDDSRSSKARIRSLMASDEAALWRDASVYQLYRRRGIEVRHPFYDIRVIRFCLQIDPGYHFHSGCFKQLLREACKGILPEQIRQRRDKAEFDSLVLQQLAAERELHPQFDSDTACLRQLLSPQIWEARHRFHAKASWDHGNEMLEWKLRNLASWLQASSLTRDLPHHASLTRQKNTTGGT